MMAARWTGSWGQRDGEADDAKEDFHEATAAGIKWCTMVQHTRIVVRVSLRRVRCLEPRRRGPADVK